MECDDDGPMMNGCQYPLCAFKLNPFWNGDAVVEVGGQTENIGSSSSFHPAGSGSCSSSLSSTLEWLHFPYEHLYLPRRFLKFVSLLRLKNLVPGIINWVFSWPLTKGDFQLGVLVRLSQQFNPRWYARFRGIVCLNMMMVVYEFLNYSISFPRTFH